MFGFKWSNICLAIIIFVLPGCGLFTGEIGGISPDKVIILDDVYDPSVTIGKGEYIAVDMYEPSASNYRIVGAFFDPTMLDLVSYVRQEEQTPQRVQYLFKTLENGSTTILIKMEPISGGTVEVYKSVSVNVSKN